MNPTWENGRKPHFGPQFGPFWPKFGPKIFFVGFTPIYYTLLQAIIAWNLQEN